MSGEGEQILIVGGGFSGMSAAIELAKVGAKVDLIEIDPGWRSYGAGDHDGRRLAARLAPARRARCVS